ncbi:MAG: hypothetical protein DRP45_07840 [Candidatus Zixiibacteriota bacterium]|nr:MAG: hypothetical protein DRP45_07840 [candidate division Zixibacteria bacterium]
MGLSFRTRIFRLLMLFAIVPAVLLALLGYYLSTETLVGFGSKSTGEITDLTDYYHGLLYKNLEQVTDAYTHGDTSPGSADFMIEYGTENGDRFYSNDTLIDLEIVASALRTIAREKERGFVALDSLHLQYVSRRLDNDRLLVVGLVHSPQYAALLSGVHREIAAEFSSRELQPTYAVFLGGLFLIVALIMLTAAYFFSSRMSGSLTRPLGDLTTAAKQIAEGDFNQQVPLQGEGEIRLLIESFNRMTLELERATSRLAQTERVAAWRQVARRFAHELKNPLQPILVSLYRIEKLAAENPVWKQIREPLVAATEEVKHLTDLAERFSHLAKLPKPKREPVDIGKLARSVVDLYDKKLSRHNFSMAMPNEELIIETDQDYLREILHNLLQNAIDACTESARIELKVVMTEEGVEIIIHDEGVGMDTATLSSARLPYFTTKEKGTGLGLAIVEKSVAELGGQLFVESERGKGTTVTLNFPEGNI